MPNIPFRALGETGVNTDIEPQDVPSSAWTDARNIQFADGTVSRYSAFKYLDPAYSYSTQPVGVVDASSISEEGFIVTVFSDGSMEQWQNGNITNVTPVGTLATGTEQITTCKLGQVTYVNRAVDVPVYRENPSDGVFVTIPGWASGDRCRSLRAYKDFLIALDCTLTGVDYPTMVKWSDAAQAGAPPANWDTTNPASLAGENVLNDVTSEIVDGLALGDSFMIYTQTEVVRMDFVGQPFIFNFNTVFNVDSGIMARNCAVEVEGKHYVFGRNDIYMHDGVSKVSLVEGVIKDKVFSELDFNNRDKCFVYHDPFQTEIGFCYPSQDDSAEWSTSDVVGCNRAVVYNYTYQTWTIVDLPSIIASVQTSSSITQSWDLGKTWGQNSTSWTSYVETARKNLLVIGTGNSALSKAAHPYYLDPVQNGRLSNSVDEDVYWQAYCEKVMSDMDELGAPLMSTLWLSRVIPQAETVDPTQAVIFQFGAANSLLNDMNWSPEMSFNPWTSYKLDTRTSGRYLGLRIIMEAGVSAKVGGFDADITVIARR